MALPARRSGRPRLEALEDRLAPATLDVTGGALTYTAGSGVNNNLTVSLTATTYTFTDTAETITLTANATTAGFAGSGTNTVTGPTSGVTASIGLALGDGTDTLALGPFNGTLSTSLPSLTVTDGGQAGDTVTQVVGGQGLIVTGSVSMTGFSAINIQGGIHVNSGTITLAASVPGGAGLNIAQGVFADGDVSLSGDPIVIGQTVSSSGTVTLTDTGPAGVTETGSGAIGVFTPAPALVLADTGTSGTFQLTGTNAVASLGGAVHGTVLLNNPQALTLDGINTNGHNLAVVSGGQVTLGDGSGTTENVTAVNAGVFLVANGLVQSSNAVVSAYGLSLEGNGAFTLGQANQVFDLAANLVGSLTYQSAQDMLLGVVGGVSGVYTHGGDLTLTGTSLLALGDGTTTAETVSAGSGNVTLNAAGVFENANAMLVGGGLQLLGTLGVVLDQANLVGTLAANVVGPVSFGNGPSLLTVGAVGGTSGISLVGDLTLNAGGGLALGDGGSTTQNISAAAVSLTAAGITQAANSVIGNTALSLQGTGTFTLTGANLVTTLAANVQGSLSYTNSTGLVVGAAGGLNGINTNNNALTLTVGGLLVAGDGTSTTQDINTGSATAEIDAAGAFLENANGAVVANALLIKGSFGCVADGSNAVGTLATQVNSFTLSFTDTQTLTVGTVLGVAGVNTNTLGQITLTADTMSLTAPIGLASTVAFQPLTLGQNITLAGSVPGTLSLTATDLAEFTGTYDTLTFGRPNGTGSITVASPIFLPGNVVLATMGTITGISNITVPPGHIVTTQP